MLAGAEAARMPKTNLESASFAATNRRTVRSGRCRASRCVSLLQLTWPALRTWLRRAGQSFRCDGSARSSTDRTDRERQGIGRRMAPARSSSRRVEMNGPSRRRLVPAVGEAQVRLDIRAHHVRPPLGIVGEIDVDKCDTMDAPCAVGGSLLKAIGAHVVPCQPLPRTGSLPADPSASKPRRHLRSWSRCAQDHGQIICRWFVRL